MNKIDDLSIFIKSITEININDLYTIDRSLFLNNIDVKNLIKKYKLTQEEIDKLFLLGTKICTQYNNMLKRNLINNQDISNIIFDKIKKYDKNKWNQLCNIIQNYYEQLKNRNIHNKVVLKKFLELLDNNDIVTDEYMLASFLKFNDGYLLLDETVKKYNIFGLTDLNDDIKIEYKYKITEYYYNFIKSCMDRITEKERKIISEDIIKFQTLEKCNSLDFCIEYIKKVRSKIDSNERNIKALFDAARESGRAIIFFDEFESLACKRGSGSTVMNRMVPELLSQMDGFRKAEGTLIILASTNRPWDLDTAVIRPPRMTERIYVGLPDHEARVYMVKKALESLPRTEEPDYEHIAEALEGYNCADIAAFVEKVKEGPIQRGLLNHSTEQYITPEDVENALANSHSSVQQSDLEAFSKWEASQR